MRDVTIAREKLDARRGRYVAHVAGVDAEGELVFTHRGHGVISADHTGVPDMLAGRGLGHALIDAMLADARAEPFRIIPLCSFVRAEYARRPEWADLFVTRPGEEP